MNESMRDFLKRASEDETLRAKLDTLAGLPQDEIAQKAAAVAQEADFDLEPEDFALKNTELDADELDAVAGGHVNCYCARGGVGANEGTGTSCLCVMVGNGKNSGAFREQTCVCVVGGEGTGGVRQNGELSGTIG